MVCVALQVVHVSSASVEMREPYIPGFLAFREVGFLLDRLDSIRQTCPHLMPQVGPVSNCKYLQLISESLNKT